jgi:kinesin family protein 1
MVPYSITEIARGATSTVRMSGNQTIITKPAEHNNSKDEDVKAFTFDKSYWSADKNDPSFADQAMVYNDLGEDLLDHAFDGYNCCIFACKF